MSSKFHKTMKMISLRPKIAYDGLKNLRVRVTFSSAVSSWLPGHHQEQHCIEQHLKLLFHSPVYPGYSFGQLFVH